MKRYLLMLVALVLGSLLLSACSTATTEAEPAEEAAAAPSVPPLGEITEDASFVTATGRLQFINSFADW